MSEENGRILSLEAARKPAKQHDLLTQKDAVAMVQSAVNELLQIIQASEQRAHDRSIAVTNNLGQQMPGLVAQMIGQALVAQGLVPEQPVSEPGSDSMAPLNDSPETLEPTGHENMIPLTAVEQEWPNGIPDGGHEKAPT